VNDTNNFKEKINYDKENIEEKIENDLDMAKLKEELRKSFSEYNTTMRFLASDAPIETLCLPSSLEKILLDQGFLRIYDLFDIDLVKVKGLGVVRIKQLTTCLDKFFSML